MGFTFWAIFPANDGKATENCSYYLRLVSDGYQVFSPRRSSGRLVILTGDFQSTSGLRMHGGARLLSHSFTWRGAQLVKYKSNIDLHVVLIFAISALPRH